MEKRMISNWLFTKNTLIYTQRLRKTIFQRRIEIRKFRVQKGFEMSNASLIQCRNSAGENLYPCGSKIKMHGKTSDFQMIFHENYTDLHWEPEKNYFSNNNRN